MDTKTRSLISCLQETHLKPRETQTESERLEKDISHKCRPKESRSSNTHIRQNRLWNKGCERDKEGLYKMVRGSIQEENITITNIYASKMGALQYVRQMLTSMKGEIKE